VVGDYVFLVYGRWDEFEPVPPDNSLAVVRVCPDRAEAIVGCNGEMSVVADETTAELATGIDGMCSHCVGYARG